MRDKTALCIRPQAENTDNTAEYMWRLTLYQQAEDICSQSDQSFHNVDSLCH